MKVSLREPIKNIYFHFYRNTSVCELRQEIITICYSKKDLTGVIIWNRIKNKYTYNNMMYDIKSMKTWRKILLEEVGK